MSFSVGDSLLATRERNEAAAAVVDGEFRQTYGSWIETAFRLAAGLERLGVRKGDRVASVLQNNWQMAALYWACQLHGYVLTPLNWRLKADELDYCLSDSEAVSVVFEPLSEKAIAGAKAARAITKIGIETDLEGVAPFADLLDEAVETEDARPDADDPSIILYTSGTTGPPKGVLRSHRAERAAAVAHVAQNCYMSAERTLGVMPLYHTMGVRSLLSSTLVDGLFVCQARFDAARSLELIEAEAITNLYLVPTLYHDLLSEPGFARTDVSSVRKLGFAGAPMTDALLESVNSAFEPDLFVNHYGSSEIYTFTVDQNAARKPGSAGKAGINQRIRVVRIDAEGPFDLADPHEEGEIIADMRSDEAFEKYWRRPEADEKAVRHGWYFSGDTGFFDDEGDLFVTGRVDDMIITGGENVSPVEIESILSRHERVDEVAVVGLPDERWGQKVVAFIKSTTKIEDAELDAHCQKSALADYKRPRSYVFVREIPRSPVGKLLRRKLVDGDYETVAEGSASRRLEKVEQQA